MSAGGKSGKGKKLGEILLELGVIDALQLQAALGHHQQWGNKLGQALLEKKLCTEADILRALAIQAGLPAIDLDHEPLDPRLVFNLPVKSAERLAAVPLRLDGKRHEILVVATAPPVDLAKVDALLSVSGKQKVTTLLASDSAVARAIGHLYYGKSRALPPPPVQHAPPAAPTGEVELELEEGTSEPQAAPAAPPPAPAAHAEAPAVLLYGWSEAAGQSLAASLTRAGLRSRVIFDAELEVLTPDAVVVTSVLALQSVLPAGVRAPGQPIICGLPHDVDAVDARAIGARIYLRPPFSAEQLKAAVAKCHAARPPGH